MVAHAYTVAFQGVEAREVDVQCHLTSGLPAFNLVGLPDKAVAESKERVRSALAAIGLALPPKRITVNLSPADLPKEGAHFDLPIALALLAAMEVIPADETVRFTALGSFPWMDRSRLSPAPCPPPWRPPWPSAGSYARAPAGRRRRWSARFRCWRPTDLSR